MPDAGAVISAVTVPLTSLIFEAAPEKLTGLPAEFLAVSVRPVTRILPFPKVKGD